MSRETLRRTRGTVWCIGDDRPSHLFRARRRDQTRPGSSPTTAGGNACEERATVSTCSHVTAYELNLAVHQVRDEGDVAGEPIELCDYQLGPVLLARGEGLRQFRPIIALAALDFDALAKQLPIAAIFRRIEGLEREPLIPESRPPSRASTAPPRRARRAEAPGSTPAPRRRRPAAE